MKLFYFSSSVTVPSIRLVSLNLREDYRRLVCTDVYQLHLGIASDANKLRFVVISRRQDAGFIGINPVCRISMQAQR